MASPERKTLVAPCGIDCGICEMYLCGENQQLMEYFLSKGFPEDKLPCKGCRAQGGHCIAIGSSCATHECVKSKEVKFCYDCSDFPCDRLNPAASRADVLPHNLKVFNLCSIKNLGLDKFVEKSSEFKQKYYKGRMEIGKGPQLS